MMLQGPTMQMRTFLAKLYSYTIASNPAVPTFFTSEKKVGWLGMRLPAVVVYHEDARQLEA